MKRFFVVSTIIVLLGISALLGRRFLHAGISSQTHSITSVRVDSDSISLGSIPRGTTKSASFFLTNTGKEDLVLYDVATSCECTQPTWSRKPIPAGETSEISIRYDPSSLGYFSKTINVKANVKGGVVKLKILGNVF